MRFILGFIGSVFAAILLFSMISNLATYYGNKPAPLASDVFHKEPKELHLASDGPFGSFKSNQAQLQRGFQVYSEVCSACHSLRLVSFRELKGIGYNEAEIKKIASDWKTQVPSINPDTGEASTRKALPSDNFPAPFANEVAARAANNNALPPDLSLMPKAREGGAAYIYSILTGYQNQPAELLKQFPDAKTPQNLHYNPYFANLNIAMPPPLKGGEVTFADGSPNDLQHEAEDVAAFLVWASEPNLGNRHAAGLAVTVFLLFASILAYLAYRQIWYEAKRAVRVTGPLEPKNQAKTRRAKAKSGVAG
jgi:ubiquinol-cytochrome c reductase cytochrome c1 subunit